MVAARRDNLTREPLDYPFVSSASVALLQY